MKNIKLITSMILFFALVLAHAQSEPSGIMNATTTSTFNYLKDGVKTPYKVKVQESREYKKKFGIEKTGNITQEIANTPAKVAKLITITNAFNPADNTLLSLKYDKQITDIFELTATERGFVISVNDKKMEYIIGKGVYFANTADKDFFVVDEFDMVK